MPQRKLLMIIGQTASGKNALSHYTALQSGLQIISMDSMKMYRGMNIGTATPSEQKLAEVQYHMISGQDPAIDLDIKSYLEQVEDIIDSNPESNYLISGGSSMYIKGMLCGLFEGIPRSDKLRAELEERVAREGVENLHAELTNVDPASGERIMLRDAKRIVRALEVYYSTGKTISDLQTQFNVVRTKYDFTVIGLRHPRPRLHERINQRVDRMYEQGLVEEAIALYRNTEIGHNASQAIGYREIFDALDLDGDPYSERVKELIKRNTRRLARKQMIWFRKFDMIQWIDIDINDTPDKLYQNLKPVLKEIDYV